MTGELTPEQEQLEALAEEIAAHVGCPDCDKAVAAVSAGADPREVGTRCLYGSALQRRAAAWTGEGL